MPAASRRMLTPGSLHAPGRPGTASALRAGASSELPGGDQNAVAGWSSRGPSPEQRLVYDLEAPPADCLPVVVSSAGTLAVQPPAVGILKAGPGASVSSGPIGKPEPAWDVVIGMIQFLHGWPWGDLSSMAVVGVACRDHLLLHSACAAATSTTARWDPLLQAELSSDCACLGS